jgi:CTD kinase subunit alpha
MAGSRRAQDIDQWRPEELSVRGRDRARERPRERIDDPRPLSPAPRAARDSSRRRTNDTDIRPSIKHARGRSRERSPSRDRTRRRSRGESQEGRRTSRRGPSSDRVPHSHRHHHHHHHHRDTTPSSKRHRSRSPSPKSANKRAKRPRSRSLVRSRSRVRRADSTSRRGERARTPPQRLDRERAPRRPTPDTYIPASKPRRRSPSADSHYRPVSHRPRKRSHSPDRRPRRDEPIRRASPSRSIRRPSTSPRRSRERSHGHRLTRDRESSRSRAPRPPRSRSPLRRRSPVPTRRHSPSHARRDRSLLRRSRSPRVARPRRSSRSPSPIPRQRPETVVGPEKLARATKETSLRGSPAPKSGYNSDTQRGDDEKMRGAYQYQGRGGSGFAQSPPYPPHNQYSPQGQSPYHGGRGGWNGQSYPTQGYVVSPSIQCHTNSSQIAYARLFPKSVLLQPESFAWLLPKPAVPTTGLSEQSSPWRTRRVSREPFQQPRSTIIRAWSERTVRTSWSWAWYCANTILQPVVDSRFWHTRRPPCYGSTPSTSHIYTLSRIAVSCCRCG